MYLYVYEGYKMGMKDRKLRTEDLVRQAFKLYAKEEHLFLGEEVCGDIVRQPSGKPYFKAVDIEFSVSHTGDLWVCLMDKDTVGVDVQIIRTCRQEKIAQRYYTADEQQLIKTMGSDSFFQIWTRKEAYAKYTGHGITEELRTISTLKEEEAAFIDFEIRANIKGSCCMKERKELWIRKIV